jgi:hypothetical protein
MMQWWQFAIFLLVIECNVVAQSITPSVVVVGLAKSGTSSLAEFFRCGQKQVAHWRCGAPVMCGDCIRKNVAKGRAAFENCGPYEVFAQIDVHRPPHMCAPPTPAVFDAIRKYENISVILSYRRAEEWADSVLRWNNLADRLVACGEVPNSTLQGVAYGYTKYIQETEAYWIQHKWPRFAIIDITSNSTAKRLEHLFGIRAECWGHFNANLGNRNKNNNKNKNKSPDQERTQTIPITGQR